jgi:hypothetical protein
MSRNAPYADEEHLDQLPPPAAPRRRISRRHKQRRWDQITVGILTPTLLVTTVVGVFALATIVYPDPNPPELVFPTATPRVRNDAAPTATAQVVAPVLDTARINAGVIERPAKFDWPEVDDLKITPNPGRPNEQADYVPPISSVESRRLISAATVTVTQHMTPTQAKAAVEELARAYPLRSAPQQVVELDATAGYLPDESVRRLRPRRLPRPRRDRRGAGADAGRPAGRARGVHAPPGRPHGPARAGARQRRAPNRPRGHGRALARPHLARAQAAALIVGRAAAVASERRRS